MRSILLIRRVITLFGGFLIIIGLLGPWVSLELYRVYKFDIPLSYEELRLSTKTYAKFSPFIFSYRILHIQSNTVTLFGEKYFYDLLATMIGIISIIGIIVGIVGPNIERWKITFLGGIVNIASTLLFLMVLPSNIYRSEYILLWRWYITILGGLFIMFSPLLKYIYLILQKNRERQKLYKKWPSY